MKTMDTLILDENKQEDILIAAEILCAGGLVAIPTETVYGLAANALNEQAVSNIYKAKGRPSDNPLIVHIADLEQIKPLVNKIDERLYKLAEIFWPGPLTIILEKSELVPDIVSAGLDTVAVRFPSNITAQAVIRAAGVPLAAPSANISGRPSPTEFDYVKRDLFGRVDAIIDGGDCDAGVESTVLSLVGEKARILRPGVVTPEQISKVIGEVEIDNAVTHEIDINQQILSPGMKYKHYSPRANVQIIDASAHEYVDYVNSNPQCMALCFDEDIKKLKVPAVSYGTRYEPEKQAHMLFSALNRLDEMGAERVYARMPSKNGVGLAVYNRLVRAAGFDIINPASHFIIGLTGASGSGKTTAGKLMAEMGCFVINCDEISKSPDVYDEDCVKKLQAYFGQDVAPNGILNRKKLAKRAFSTKEGTENLNRITHPKILVGLKKEIAMAEQSGEKIIVLDAPTLFESGADSYCSRILVITAPEKIRLERIMKRDSISGELAKSRIKAQFGNEFYSSRADFEYEGINESELKNGLINMVSSLRKELEMIT